MGCCLSFLAVFFGIVFGLPAVLSDHVGFLGYGGAFLIINAPLAWLVWALWRSDDPAPSSGGYSSGNRNQRIAEARIDRDIKTATAIDLDRIAEREGRTLLLFFDSPEQSAANRARSEAESANRRLLDLIEDD